MRSVQLQKVYDVAAQIEKKEWEQYRKLGKILTVANTTGWYMFLWMMVARCRYVTHM